MGLRRHIAAWGWKAIGVGTIAATLWSVGLAASQGVAAVAAGAAGPAPLLVSDIRSTAFAPRPDAIAEAERRLRLSPLVTFGRVDADAVLAELRAAPDAALFVRRATVARHARVAETGAALYEDASQARTAGPGRDRMAHLARAHRDDAALHRAVGRLIALETARRGL